MSFHQTKAHKEHLATQVLPDQQVRPVPQAHKGLPVPLAQQVRLERQDQQERQEQRVHKDRLDLQVLQEAKDQLDRLAQLDLKELLAQLDQLVPPEQQALQEARDLQDPQVQ